MTKFELLTVLRSMELAIKNGSKDDVEQFIKKLINDVENDTKRNKK